MELIATKGIMEGAARVVFLGAGSHASGTDCVMNWDEEREKSREVEVVWKGNFMLAFGAVEKCRKALMVAMYALGIEGFRSLACKFGADS